MALSQLPGLQETEEQRRRRLAAEAVAAGQAPPAESTEAFRVEVGGIPIYADSPKASTITPPAGFKLMSTSQADAKPTGAYYDPALNAWFAPATDTGMPTVAGTQQDGREGEAQAQARMTAPVAPVAPVKQTITTDPVTGEQRMKIEGSVQDLSASNPLTPTVITPQQPQQELTQQEPPQQVAPAPAAAVPPGQRLRPPIEIPGVAPVAPGMMDPAQRAQQAQTQQAAPAAGPVPGAPGIMDPAQRAQAELAAASGPAAGTTQLGVMDPAQRAQATPFEAALTTTTDPGQLITLSKDPTYTPEQKQVFAAEAQSKLTQQVGEAKGREQLSNMNEDELARLLRSKNSEGSWAKMIMLGYISPELAGREAVKLGLNAKYETVRDQEGKSFLIKMRGDGIPMEGYDAATGAKLKAKDLVRVAGMAGGQALGMVGGTYINDSTGEVGRVVTNEKTGISYVQTDTGRKPLTGFRPQTGSGSLEQQGVAQTQQKNIDLAADWARLQMRVQGAAPEAANRFLGEFNAKHQTNFGLSSVSGPPPQISTIAPGATPAAAPGATPAAAPATGPAVPVATTPAAAQPVSGPSVPVAATGGGGRSPAQIAQSMDIGSTAAKTNIETQAQIKREELRPPAAEKGKQAAADVKNQAFADRTYKLIAPINDAIQRSTGSGIGAGLDKAAAFIGSSTEGSKAIAELNMLSYNILANIPRFEGPQSDIDVQMYKQAAGDFNNRTLPVADRLAALDVLVSILKSYDKAGKNDWTYSKGQPGQAGQAGQAAPAGNIRIIKREKVQ